MASPSTPHHSRVRRMPVPQTSPPYDDEIGATPPRSGRRRTDQHPAPVQGALALSITGPNGWPPAPQPEPTLRLVTDSPAAPAAPAPTLPDPRRWCARIAQAMAEILYGRRPIQQLVRWTSHSVYATLSQHTTRRRRTDPPAAPTVRSMRLCHLSAQAVEAAVVLQTGERTRAMALRFEARGDRWMCTALDLL